MPKFTPKNPFELHEHGTHFGNKPKGSRFMSDLIRDHIEMSGVYINIYRYKGTFAQDSDELNVRVNDKESNPSSRELSNRGQEPVDLSTFLGIQDPILNENRDREYDFDEIPVLKGAYSVSQNELEYARFGMALQNDVLTIEFHTETMERECGRRLIPGDVIECPHLREVGIDGRVANKWYEVDSIVKSPMGYDPYYMHHVHAVVVKPLRHQQEFLDIFERRDEYGKTLAEQASMRDQQMAQTEAIQEKAGEHAYTTWHDTTMMWFCPDHPSQKPYRWTDDAKPPNGEPVAQGTYFPATPVEGDWFVRTDFAPNKLYRFQDGKWRLREVDIKREWQPYNWVVKLREFMSDRQDQGENRDEPIGREWELRSIHDVITDREERSVVSPQSREESNAKEADEDPDNEGRIG